MLARLCCVFFSQVCPVIDITFLPCYKGFASLVRRHLERYFVTSQCLTCRLIEYTYIGPNSTGVPECGGLHDAFPCRVQRSLRPPPPGPGKRPPEQKTETKRGNPENRKQTRQKTKTENRRGRKPRQNTNAATDGSRRLAPVNAPLWFITEHLWPTQSPGHVLKRKKK